MDYLQFKESLAAPTPPEGLSNALRALWYDAKGDWAKAHEQAQAQEDAAGAWVHAYLHRKEGDLANAAYWYRRAGQAVATQPLEAEWDVLATVLLGAPQTRR
ncbi:MAG TPA: hypothetical protein VFU22_00835 [Roseiflexaceae bacterium]|nr:hypothetical protein [Roseiflexaceae bacterium]